MAQDYRGWVYVASNPTQPDLLKIGYSDADPLCHRLKTLWSTGVATPFVLEYSCLVWNPKEVEQKGVHAAFDNRRRMDVREHFDFKLPDELHLPIRYLRDNHEIILEHISLVGRAAVGDAEATAAAREITRVSAIIPRLEELIVPWTFSYKAARGEIYGLEKPWAAYYQELKAHLGREPGPSEQQGNLTLAQIARWPVLEEALKISKRVQSMLQATKEKMQKEGCLPPGQHLYVKHEAPDYGIVDRLRDYGLIKGETREEVEAIDERRRKQDIKRAARLPPA